MASIKMKNRCGFTHGRRNKKDTKRKWPLFTSALLILSILLVVFQFTGKDEQFSELQKNKEPASVFVSFKNDQPAPLKKTIHWRL